MGKGQTTRTTIVDQALHQAISVGLEGISLGGIASALGLSKSGLFAHFSSKEALQLAVLDAAIERFGRVVVLSALPEPRAIVRLERLVVGLLDWMRGNEHTPGCLFSTMVQEYDDRPGPIRDRLVAAQAEWRSLLAAVVSAAVGEGDLPAGTDPAQVAFEIVGIGAAFQQTHQLFHDPTAHARAVTAFRRLIHSRLSAFIAPSEVFLRPESADKSTTGRTFVDDPFVLRSGARLPNRIVKVSTEEALADADLLPSDRLIRLYRRFAEGGAGMLLTGAVVIDRRARVRPRDVVIDGPTPLAPFRRWAEAATDRGVSIWMQLNHSGRQTPSFIAREPVGPSAIPAVKILRSFGRPRAMTADEIRDVVRRFTDAADLAAHAGFSGVQIHAAHGYLLSQFLSPSSNLRTDAWGGTAERRARLLLDVVDAVGERVAGRCGVSVKLNATDMQRDGVDPAAFRDIVALLADRPLDFLEVSGGTYEASAFEGARLGAKEAYFADAARSARAVTSIPLLLTGGLRSRTTMDQVLGDGVADLVGLARPMVVDPELPRKLLSGSVDAGSAPETHLRSGSLAALVDFAWYGEQLHRHADRRPLASWGSRWWLVVRNVLADHWRVWGEGRRGLPVRPPEPSGSAPTDAVAWIAAFTAFWAAPRGQLARLHDLLDPEVRLVAPGFRATTGIDAGLMAFERTFAAFPDLTARVDRWVVDGDWLFVEMTFSATVGRRWLEWHNVDRLRLRDGRAVERIAYNDPSRIRRALSTSLAGLRQWWRLRPVAA